MNVVSIASEANEIESTLRSWNENNEKWFDKNANRRANARARQWKKKNASLFLHRVQTYIFFSKNFHLLLYFVAVVVAVGVNADADVAVVEMLSRSCGDWRSLNIIALSNKYWVEQQKQQKSVVFSLSVAGAVIVHK